MKGFTLLELVIASALTVLLAGTTAALMLRGMTSAQRGEQFLQQTFLLERTAEKMGRELRNAVPSAERRFEGLKGDLSFLVSESPVALASVRYHLVPSGKGFSLVRDRQVFPPKGNPSQTSVVLAGVVNFSILYGMISEQGGRRQLVWSERWMIPPVEPAALPELVRVRLESQDPKGRLYSVTREFWIPQGVLKESVA